MNETQDFPPPNDEAVPGAAGKVEAAKSDSYVKVAQRLLAERAIRSGIIEPNLVGEPAWDILLSAYVADPAVPRAVVEACSVDGIAFIVGFRWFKVLESANLMQRSQIPGGDCAKATLTPHGRSMLESYFDTIMASAP